MCGNCVIFMLDPATSYCASPSEEQLWYIILYTCTCMKTYSANDEGSIQTMDLLYRETCNPRCAVRVTVVGRSVCLSISYSTSHFCINDTTYLTGNKGQKFCGVFSKTTAFGRYGVKREQKANMLMSIAYCDRVLHSYSGLFR